ncbi:Zinc-ribbon domain-containing protein, partial [Dysosmobacter welbionis]
HGHLAYQFFLERPVQLPGAVAGERDPLLRAGPGKPGEAGEHRLPLPCIGQDDAAGALMDHGLTGPGLTPQPGFQQIRLAEGHGFLLEPQAHPAPALMYDGRFH